MATRSREKTETKPINLALQGGGSHGAFTWGVLDRLLEEASLDIEGVVGTSAGALNATVLAYGITVGGREGARAKLAEFWKANSDSGRFMPQPPMWFDRAGVPVTNEWSPAFWIADAMLRIFSPYSFNPLNINPVRDVLERTVDFAVLRERSAIKLFLCASNVRSGRIRVFEGRETSVDAVLASACLPQFFQAVEIDGEHYWDGGYMGNPALFPLIYHCKAPDILLVMIEPVAIDQVPRTARDIIDRTNSLSFNSSLMREMRAIHFVNKLVERGFDDEGRLKAVNIHCVDAEDSMRGLDVSSKASVRWDFLMYLHELGRSRCEAFLGEHYDKIGRESSVSFADRFL